MKIANDIKGRTFEHGIKKDPQKWANTSRKTAIAQWSDPICRYHFDKCKVAV